jgi:hypothetical protein
MTAHRDGQPLCPCRDCTMNRIVTHSVAFIRRYEFPVDMESLLQRANSYRVDPTEAARDAAFLRELGIRP